MFTLLSSCRGQGCIPLWHRSARTFFVLLCFVLSALPTVADSFQFTLDRFTFTCYDDGTAMLTNWESDNDIKTVTIPATVSAKGKTYQVTAIGECAFQYCSGLTSVTFPDGLTEIGVWAFRGCSGLTSVTLPKSLSSIGDACFIDTNLREIKLSSENPYLKLVDGVLFTADQSNTLVFYPKGDNRQTYSIPEGTRVVAPAAFQGCTNLTSVTFPEGLTYIGGYAFDGCYGLTSVTFPKGLTWIALNAFRCCYWLTSVTFPEGMTGIESGAFESCYRLTSVTFPDGLTYIGDHAFRDCSGLTSVTFPKGLTDIGGYAFYKCSGLTSVTFPDGLTSIGGAAFQNCAGLTSVTFPDGLTYIGDHAFRDCSGLTSVTFPEGLTRIESYAFRDCSGLTSVISKAQQAPPLGYGVFNTSFTLHLPYGAEGYDRGDWADFANRKTFLDLSDQAEQFSANKEEGDVEVSYTRTFHNTAWQPLFVPFDISVDAVAEKYAVAIVEDEQQAGSVNFRTLDAGETLPANSIALVRAKQEGEQVMKINATTVRPFEAVEKTVGDYTFRGTREATTALQLPNRWIMAGGKLHPAQTGAKLNTFRWYLDVQGSAPTQGLALNIREGNRITTIGRITAEGEAEIYDLAGRRLPQSHSRGQLRIVNGQKSF